jgi:hypothetical protein
MVARLNEAAARQLGKLDVLIAVGTDGAEGLLFPWPDLRRIRRDAVRLEQP